jgi:hypothetical protein
MNHHIIGKLSIFFVMSLCCATGAVAEDGWTNISVSEKNRIRYDVKKGSFDVTTTKGGVSIAVVVGRISDPKSSKVSVYKWYVPLKACVDKFGTVVSLNMAGEYQFENDFVFDSGNIAAAMGETICAVAELHFATKEKKGI